MSQREDSRKLNELLASAACGSKRKFASVRGGSDMDEAPAMEGSGIPSDNKEDFGGLVQWTTSDGKRFVPASHTAERLTPGVYEIVHSNTIGIYFERIPVITQGLLRFPQTNSEKVVNEIQKFWDKEEIFREYKLTHKRGMLLYGPPGCHAKGTLVRMFDGSVKKVEDVCAGDELMGPDSKPRKVLELRRGRDYMYRVTPMKGESFEINGHHVLSLTRSRTDDRRYPPTVNVTLNDYMGLTRCSQNSFKLQRIGVEFTNSGPLPLNPYFLGLWLGDGTESNTQVTTADDEIKNWLYSFAESMGLSMTADRKTDSICRTYTLVGDGSKGGNVLRNTMNGMGVLGRKFIPEEFMTASREDRLFLLAGIVDTDGGHCVASWRAGQKFKRKGYKGYFEIIQKRLLLARQIVELARSLGFGATIVSVKKGIKKNNFVGEYWRVNIFGNIADIPVLLARKKSLAGMPNKDSLRTGIREIEPLGLGDFYGFTLSGDHLYLTADYMVHHNSGKSCTIQIIMKDVVERHGIVVKFTHPTLFNEGMRKLREIEPTTPVVVLMEDIDSILENFNESEVLNILDGINQIEKAVFLACPSPDHLILKTDLTWVRADSLVPGDELIAFDEEGDRRFKTAKVNSCPLVDRPCFRVTSTTGDSFVVSEKHPFLVKMGNRPHEWRAVEDLRPGNRIVSIGKPWSTDESREAGYMAGQYDGEGTINFTYKTNATSAGFRVNWVQASGPVADNMERLLRDRGFEPTVYKNQPAGTGRFGPYKEKTSINVLGGRWESLRLLGSIRPHRLLAHHNLREAWEGARLHTTEYVVVSNVEAIGVAPVVALDTTSKTFIGEGMLQHNTTNYPENLGARIVNRPSRFDKRFQIGHPDAESRKLYFRHIIGEAKILKLNIDLNKWVADTEDFSIAHLKELFTAVVILGDDYDEAVDTLREMKEEHISSNDDERRKPMGFASNGKMRPTRFSE